MMQIKINNNLHLYRYKSGVKFIQPQQRDYYLGKDTGYKIEDLFQLPFNIGICDSDNIIQYVNQSASISMGYASEKALLGKSSNHVYTSESSMDIVYNRKNALTKKSIQMTEENLIIKKNGMSCQRLSIRLPWYDDYDKVIGLMNASITLGKHSLSDSLMQITDMLFLQNLKTNNKSAKSFSNNVYLTSRERQVAFHVMHGKTAKLISEILFISKRTAEVHIENIKNKFGISSKALLVDKLFDFFTDDISQ